MKKYTMYIVFGIAVALGVVIYVLNTQPKESPPVPSVLQTEISPTLQTTSENNRIQIDLKLCTLQQEKVYRCPASALTDFGPAMIKNTGQTTSCKFSYNSKNGFSFEGPKKSAKVSAGEFLVSVSETDAIANFVRSGESMSLTFFVGENERIVHVLIVDGKDYSSDQCLEI